MYILVCLLTNDGKHYRPAFEFNLNLRHSLRFKLKV